MSNYKAAANRVCAPGETYGTLTVIKFDTPKNSWLCSCICGKLVLRGGNALKKYVQPNCGCKRGREALLPNQLSRKRAIIYNYKKNAKDRNFCYELTDEQAIEMFEKDCFYCSLPPSNVMSVKPSRRLRNKYCCNVGDYIYSGIDRVDSTKGYTLDNCVPCCFTCNFSKSNIPLEDWKAWAKRLCQKMFNDQPQGVESSDSKRETPIKTYRVKIWSALCSDA